MADSEVNGSPSRSARKTLAVVIHGLHGSPANMTQVVETARRAYDGDLTFYVPDLPQKSWFSGKRATTIVRTVLAGIDERVAAVAPDRIILIGHSIGATLARRIYLVAAGFPDNFRPEAALAHEVPRAWANRVERIVMFAAFNRGWKISPRLSWYYSIMFNVVAVIGHLVPGRKNWTPTAFDFRLERGPIT